MDKAVQLIKDLSMNPINNVLNWKLSMKAMAFKEFGFLANLFDHDGTVVYSPPLVREEDYTPPVIIGDPNPMPVLSAAVLLHLREKAEEERNKEVRQLRRDRPRLFSMMQENISFRSWETIRQSVGFAANEAAKDPHVLWGIIIRTHLTQIQGGNATLRMMDRSKVENDFSVLRQRNKEHITGFKLRFDQMLETLIAAGVDPLNDATKAIKFLEKLDKDVFWAMNDQLTNAARQGLGYPPDLHTAWDIASNYLMSNPKLLGGGGNNDTNANPHSVYLADAQMNKDRDSGKKKGKEKDKKDGGGKGGGNITETPEKKPFVDRRKCHNCGEIGHIGRNRHQSSAQHRLCCRGRRRRLGRPWCIYGKA